MPATRDRILVADDSAVARAAVARELAHDAVSLVEAASLRDGLGVDAGALEGAVLDLDLGDGSGVTLAQALRKAAPDLPIAFFSDSASHAAAEARAIGPLFQKPGDLGDLIAWVRALRGAVRP